MNTPSLWFNPRNFPSRLVGSYDGDDSPHFLSFSMALPIPPTDPLPIFRFDAPRRRLVKFDALPNEDRFHPNGDLS
jgi:hypothetical protein